MENLTAKTTTNKIKDVISRFGIMENIVFDNGPPFFPEEIKVFCKNNNISHILAPPYSPYFNGWAERAVQIVKKGLKKKLENNYKFLNIHQRINRFLC